MTLDIVYPEDVETLVTIDIVAVHGLGGDPFKTWTHKKSEAFWLKDFLPKQIPDARIMTFGYNAAKAFGQTTSEIIDHAKGLLSSLVNKRQKSEEQDRPIIFISHSLGGIVVKQALLQARLEARYKSVCDATLGIVFFGTPHRGSKKASYGKVLSSLAQTLAHRPSSSLIAALRQNSAILKRLTSDFRFQLAQYHIISFYEQRPMAIFKSLIVEKDSALLETDQEEQIPVDADHREMCRFQTQDDETFETVYTRIQGMRSDPRPGRTISYNRHYEVPHLLSPVFTGHAEAIESLDASLALAEDLSRPVQRRFVLSGPGGSGKTQICLKYAERHREGYWGIFWIDASSSDSLQRGLTQVAIRLGAEKSIDGVKRALANNSHKWLLVFDNANDPDLSLAPYFPTGDRGHIVITSRYVGSRIYNTVGYREIGRMSVDDSESLLFKIAYGDTAPEKSAEEDGREIVEALGCLPLSVVQAGAYICETSCSLQEYLESYQKHRDQVLRYVPKHTGTDYRETVYTTWELSLNMIKSMHNSPTSNNALGLLNLLCFYHHDQVPFAMFYNAWHNTRDDPLAPTFFIWPVSYAEFVEYRNAVQTTVTLLASFALVTRDSDQTLSLHPTAHDWCRDRMSRTDQQYNCRLAVALLASSVTQNQETEDFNFRRSLVSHVYACLKIYDRADEEFDERAMEEWKKMTGVVSEYGLREDAILLKERYIKLCNRRLGEGNALTLSLTRPLAREYLIAGRRNEGLNLIKDLMKVTEKLPQDHPFRLSVAQDLADFTGEVGRSDEAIHLFEEVLQGRRRKLGESHLDTLKTMRALADEYRKDGQQEAALELARQAFKLSKDKLDNEDVDILEYVAELGFAYREALPEINVSDLMEQVLELQKARHGKDHLETICATERLADIYDELGRKIEAIRLTEYVFEHRKNHLGEDHDDTLSVMWSLECRYFQNGRFAETIEILEQLFRLLKRKKGADHPDTLSSMYFLGVSYTELERDDEAVQTLEQLVEIHRVKSDDDDPERLDATEALAFVYGTAGRFSEAVRLMKHVVRIRESKFGADNELTINSKERVSRITDLARILKLDLYAEAPVPFKVPRFFPPFEPSRVSKTS